MTATDRLDLVSRSHAFATKAHQGQVDRSGRDFIEHPRRVAANLQAEGADPITIAAAVLLDVVEDTDTSLDVIEALFGRQVRLAVDAVSRREGETYVDFIERARLSPRGRRVKRADILDNLYGREVRPAPSLAKRYHAALRRLAI